MREDMAKVIVERPRFKPWNTRRGRLTDPENLPATEGMRRGHALRGERKQLNENLAPLRRYLAKQVGRPWANIYSDISAHLRADNTVQQHVRDHLRDFVAIKPGRGRNGKSWSNGLWWQPFYVHPVTGLLCCTADMPEVKARERADRNRKAPPADRIALSEDRELRKIEGHWYEVCLAPFPEAIYAAVPTGPAVRRLISTPVWDVVARSRIVIGPPIDTEQAWKAYRVKHPDPRYAVAKRTLSRRELQRRGLRNDADEV